MAINKNKVVTFNDLEKYTGISSGPEPNFTITPPTYGFGPSELNYFKGIILVPTLDLSNDEDLKYLYYGYYPTKIFDDTQHTLSGGGWVPMMHYNTTTWINNLISSIFNLEDFWGCMQYGGATNNYDLITYSEVQSMDLDDEDTVNDIWMTYHPVKDPSTGEIMKDENGNILYEEGRYYAEKRKREEPITL